jgi:hypothetical protein
MYHTLRTVMMYDLALHNKRNQAATVVTPRRTTNMTWLSSVQPALRTCVSTTSAALNTVGSVLAQCSSACPTAVRTVG